MPTIMVMATESIAVAPLDGRRYPSPVVKQDLAKLGKDAESRRAALGSLRAVVEEHLHGPALSRFMHQLEDSAEGRRHAAAIISDLARAHGDRLSPYIPRLLQILAHTLLASASCPALQSDCAKAVAAIGKHSVASSPSSAELVLKRLCLPLIALLPHKVELLSAGSAACLNALVESDTWKFATVSLVSKLSLKSAMALSSKSAQTVPHLNLLRALASVNASALAQFSIPLLRLLNQEILLCSSASWQLRLAAIQLMESLFKVAEQTTLVSHLGLSLQNLAKCRLDKMPHVRKAAMSALRAADVLAARRDIKQKLLEDLSTAHSHTEPSSPLRHSLDSLGNIEDLFRGPLSSPRSQRSHALFVSPRTLTELAVNSPSTKQQGSQTPLSDQSPGRATTDESDYFCAYFFDTKENVSCRKIVHHIHDTAIGLATPPSSPLKQSHKVAVPPLPLSSVVHTDLGGQAVKSGHSQSAVSTPSSVTRHVMVLDSHAELVSSCERSSIFAASAEENATREEDTLSSIQASKPLKMSKASSDTDFINQLPKSRITQNFTQQRMQAMEDLQAISSRLLEIREAEEEEEENVNGKEESRDQQMQDSFEREAEEEEEENVNGKEESRDQQMQGSEGDERQGDASAHVESERHEQRVYDYEEVVCASVAASSQHNIKDNFEGKEDQEAAETSSDHEEWSVRNNPIADAPVSELPSDSNRKCAQLVASSITGLSSDVVVGASGDGACKRRPAEAKRWNREDLDEFEEAEEEVLESCKDEASETEENFEIEVLDTARSSMVVDPAAEMDELYGRPPQMRIHQRGKASKLRSFLMGSTACVIPIAVVSMVQLFYVELLLQEVAFMPPT
ncbi:hypothetical protein GOP47_0013087 [Adiantum capillus-veneris]|uniref:TORTIFOLIA1/SINE1-2 N-terminal domain-containing protein n=1 Tax=Adiantum capillus-veneris TaxID=13818 RepID=A0A9D4US37_ADICA|nr:hypothetical protein GOP47_0013087 [Adiantum capillus-veneris]